MFWPILKSGPYHNDRVLCQFHYLYPGQSKRHRLGAVYGEVTAKNTVIRNHRSGLDFGGTRQKSFTWF
jgi:hypothetical protein